MHCKLNATYGCVRVSGGSWRVRNSPIPKSPSGSLNEWKTLIAVQAKEVFGLQAPKHGSTQIHGLYIVHFGNDACHVIIANPSSPTVGVGPGHFRISYNGPPTFLVLLLQNFVISP